MTVSYCVHCKRKTEDVNPKIVETKNGKMMRKSTCAICGHKKSCFVGAHEKGSGIRGMNLSGTKTFAGSGVRRRKHRKGGDLNSFVNTLGNVAGAVGKIAPLLEFI